MAKTMKRPASAPEVIQNFRPVSNQSSPSCTARVSSANASEPEFGSGWRARLKRFVWDVVRASVERQQQFNTTVVAHLEPQLEDPAAANEILKRLGALQALLRSARGPYR